MAGVCCARQTAAPPVKHTKTAATTFMARRIYHKRPEGRADSADKQCMQPMLLLITLALSMGLALAISRLFLAGVFHLMTHRSLPFVFHWRRVVFAAALFWLWYLTPAIAAGQTTRVIHFFLIP